MDVFVIRNGTEYAGQTWWDGTKARWDGPDPYRLRPYLGVEHAFVPRDLPDSGGGLNMVASVMPEERMISSFADLGVIARMARTEGADVEVVSDVASAPVDPRSTPKGKRLHGTPRRR